MNLLLDIGNTRIKWAWSAEERINMAEPLIRDSKSFKDLAPAEWENAETPERVIVSNVAGAVFAKSVRTWVKRVWRIDTEFVMPAASACGVTNAYIHPERLGPDRWAALIAAHHLFRKSPVCILDCGSAVTIDALAADGRHMGGLIVPGLAMMERVLVSKTSGIKLENVPAPEISLLARDTETAVQGGTLYALVALIDRVFADLGQELGRSAKRVDYRW